MELTIGHQIPAFPRILLWVLAATQRAVTFWQTANREEVNASAERWLDAYGNAILRLSYTYVHSMDDAEDILQETLMRVLEANPAFESAAHEKAYLLRTAANLAKNRIDYNRLRETDELPETLADEGREDLSYVWEAVSALPAASRDVLHLYYYEGYSTQDIARILGRKETTVRSDLMRARERLRIVLQEEYDFDQV